jgi:hypothetical protein
MAHLDIRTTYAVHLTPEEFRLVGLALAGKLKPGAETTEAAELNARFQEMRLKQVTLAHEACEAAYEKAREVQKETEGQRS